MKPLKTFLKKINERKEKTRHIRYWRAECSCAQVLASSSSGLFFYSKRNWNGKMVLLIPFIFQERTILAIRNIFIKVWMKNWSDSAVIELIVFLTTSYLFLTLSECRCQKQQKSTLYIYWNWWQHLVLICLKCAENCWKIGRSIEVMKYVKNEWKWGNITLMKLY